MPAEYAEMFAAATGGAVPFDWQERLAAGPRVAQVIRVPTGAGKTEGAWLGWLSRRRHAPQEVRRATRGGSSTACRCARWSSRPSRGSWSTAEVPSLEVNASCPTSTPLQEVRRAGAASRTPAHRFKVAATAARRLSSP